MKSIYLACPYWHEDPEVREERYVKVNKQAGLYMKEGLIVFSPISHSHPISLTMDNQDHSFWLEQDYYWLDKCDELWVFTLPGWEVSFGVSKEIKRAKSTGKTVRFV